jgi:hypothetical protein
LGLVVALEALEELLHGGGLEGAAQEEGDQKASFYMEF